MNILSLDSSDKGYAIGLSLDGRIVETKQEECWQRQSELLSSEIASLLDRHLSSRRDLDAVIASKGPGSYTGVRIALTIAKTIALALNIPLYVCSSLQALCKRGQKSLCLMNARGKRSYAGVYEDGKCLLQDQVLSNQEVLTLIKEHPDYLCCGDLSYLGIEGYKADVAANLLSFVDESHLSDNPLGERPVYLKDEYQAGKKKLVIRKAIPSDIDSILSIENDSFKHPYTREQLLYELNENPVAHFFSAIVDAEVIGFIIFFVTFDSASIAQIAVRPDFRGKGIGDSLLKAMVKECKSQIDEVDNITLEVRKSNVNAHRFYSKRGFEDIVVKKGYYDDGEDAVYMVRCIVND